MSIPRDIISMRPSDQNIRMDYLFNKPRPGGGANFDVDMDYMTEKSAPGGKPPAPLRLSEQYTTTRTNYDDNGSKTTETTTTTTSSSSSSNDYRQIHYPPQNQSNPSARAEAIKQFAKRGRELYNTKFEIERINLELDKYNDEWKEMESKTNAALAQRIRELWEWRVECEWRSARHQKDWRETQMVLTRLRKVLHWLTLPLECIQDMRNITIKYLDDYPGHPLGRILDAEYQNVQRLIERLNEYEKRLISHADDCEQIKLVIDRSWSDNWLALQLDEHVATLDARSPYIMFKPEASTPVTAMHVPERVWVDRNLEQLARSDEIMGRTKPLLAFCDELINDTSAGVTMGYQEILSHLQDFLHRLVARKNVLENMLQKTYKDMDDVDKNLMSLQLALSDNHRPLMLAQTRKWVRHFRPEAEKVIDQPDGCIDKQLKSVLDFNARNQEPFRALIDRAELLRAEAVDMYKEICNLKTNAVPALQEAINRCQKYPDLGQLLGNAA